MSQNTDTRVLVADDNERMRDSTGALLESEGFNVSLACSGDEVIKALLSDSFDLLLLDLKMPGLTGFEVMEYIEANEIDVEVIVVSGETSFDSVQFSLRHGAHDYLRKPFSVDDLLHAMARSIRQRKLQRENQRMQQQLARSERMHRYMVDASPDIIYILDKQGHFRFINHQVEELLGFDREELLGQHYSTLVHPDDLPQAKHIFNERRTGDRAAANLELRLRKKSPAAPAAHFDTTAIPIEINAMGIYGTDPESPASMENFEGTYGVARDISERKRAEQMIRYQAHHDILTGLPNRALFNDHLKLALSQARRNQQLVGVLFIDLDGFKIVNDTMGHMFGDQLLQSVAERFSGSLRSADTLARIGGDEFMLLVPGLDSAQHTTAVAQKMLSRLKNPFLMDDEEIFIGASIGIAIFPHDGDTIDELVRKADIAMYQAKGKDKGGFRFYSEEMEGATARRLTVESGLRRAIDRGEFSVVYQPQFNAKSGRIIGVEALLRWNHPSGTVVSPLEFVPVAEEAGLIIPIGNWMIDNALHTLANWRLSGLTDLRMALNISAIQLESDDFIDTITRILREYEIPGECLEIEITENALVNDLDSAAVKLNKLASFGVSIAIDDFGTGYSSLGQLHRLPINVLKIDRCFVQDMGKDESSSSIVRSIVAMANGLGMEIIAEGVETPYQHQQLMSIQCNNMQGFLYSHPVEAESVPMLLSGSKAINEIFTLQ